MNIDFQTLVVGQSYSRPTLAKLWGYQDWHAIGKGIVKPTGVDKIILFITAEKQETLEQYKDDFDGKVLIIDGQAAHGTDHHLVDPSNETHLFYRKSHHTDFVYYGVVKLTNFELKNGTSPSRFEYKTSLKPTLCDKE